MRIIPTNGSALTQHNRTLASCWRSFACPATILSASDGRIAASNRQFGSQQVNNDYAMKDGYTRRLHSRHDIGIPG